MFVGFACWKEWCDIDEPASRTKHDEVLALPCYHIISFLSYHDSSVYNGREAITLSRPHSQFMCSLILTSDLRSTNHSPKLLNYFPCLRAFPLLSFPLPPSPSPLTHLNRSIDRSSKVDRVVDEPPLEASSFSHFNSSAHAPPPHALVCRCNRCDHSKSVSTR